MKLPLFVCSVVIILIYSFVLVSAENVSQGIHNPTESYNHQVTIVPVFKISSSLRSHILKILLAQFEERKNVSIQLNEVKCEILSNWRRISYFDTTKGDPCPSGLRTVSNTTTNQTACGRNVSIGCTSLLLTTDGSYTNVCGRTRGYQFGSADAFGHILDTDPIDSAYLDGISFTYGSPRTHLWSFVAGHQEDLSIYPDSLADCPCSRADPTDKTNVPSYVQDNYYCESGFVDGLHGNIAWEDPLWDGSRCTIPGNQCCHRYGWFHQEVPTTSDDIEVRWCADEDQENEDVFTDQLEIWVM